MSQTKGFCRIFTVYHTGKSNTLETFSLARAIGLLFTLLCPASRPMQTKAEKRFVLGFFILF